MKALWILFDVPFKQDIFKSRVVWDCSSNTGGSYFLRLNMDEIPIAHKYCEGKVKSTYKKELKEHEIVMRGT